MSISEQQKNTLLIVLFSGVVVFLLIVYINWMIGRGIINDFERKTVNAHKELFTQRQQLKQIEITLSKKEEVDKQAEFIRKVTSRLPTSVDAPGFYDELVKGLATTGIVQEEVRPDPTINRTIYTEIPYKIKAQGHFHAFGQFLTLIEQNPMRFMRVKNMKISNDTRRPSLHPIEMEIVTFKFTSRPGEGAQSQDAPL